MTITTDLSNRLRETTKWFNEATASAEEASHVRADLIVKARRDGATWRAIAQASGITENSARKAAARVDPSVFPRYLREQAAAREAEAVETTETAQTDD